MLGQHRVHEGVVAVQQIQNRAVVVDQIGEEADRLLEHRLAQLIVEARESLAVHGIEVFEMAEVQPVAAEFRGEAARTIVFQHAAGLREQHGGLRRGRRLRRGPAVPRRACSTRGSSSACWPARRRPSGRVAADAWSCGFPRSRRRSRHPPDRHGTGNPARRAG